MQTVTLLLFAVVLTVALAEGQYYVPRAYYTIDAEGHQSAPVPMRRLRRSLNPYPYPYGGANANANANAEANAWGGGSASANAQANARAGSGGWGLPIGAGYGAANPNALSFGETRRQSGPVLSSRSISAGSSVGIDSSGKGYYDQYTSVGN
ncbi:uncharacterized protein LOC111004074 isoform X1 [Pieris rapae]|uniref:uncharacterized protein LOC111004074 isoform X1 n=1 Tax=Pieris rapae TaxID=64459 RepID=UPI001E27C370|nr:uncharacterized protein LOC111004074 isoform X1 [Pieris rapae]